MKTHNHAGIWEAIKDNDLAKLSRLTREDALNNYATSLEHEIQRLESENARLQELLFKERGGLWN